MTTLTLLFAEPLSVEQLFNVKTTKVERVEKAAYKEFYAQSVVDESKVKEVSLRYDAFIQELYANKTFMRINKGDYLAKVYSPEVYNAQQELLNALRLNNKRIQKALEEKLLLLGVEKRTIETIKRNKKAYEYIFVSSKHAGLLRQKSVNEGGFIPRGKRLFEITDYSSLWVVASVYEKELGFLKNASHAEIRFDMSDVVYKSKIERIYPKTDAKTKSVQVRFQVANNTLTLHENAFAKVRVYEKARSYLRLPVSAVITKGKKQLVFVAGEYEGEYEAKAIRAKRLNNKSFEILEGLKEGEQVVDNALFMFDSDAQINGSYDD